MVRKAKKPLYEPTITPTAAPGGIEAGRLDATVIHDDWEVVDDPFSTDPPVDRKRRTLRLEAHVDPEVQRASDMLQHAKIRWSAALAPGFAEAVGLDNANVAGQARALAELEAREIFGKAPAFKADELNQLFAGLRPEDLPSVLPQLSSKRRAQVWNRAVAVSQEAHERWAADKGNRGLQHDYARWSAATTVSAGVNDHADNVWTYTTEARKSPTYRTQYHDYANTEERALAKQLSTARKRMKDAYDDSMKRASQVADRDGRAKAAKARIEAAPPPPKGTAAAAARKAALELLGRRPDLKFPKRDEATWAPLVWDEPDWVYNMKPPMRITRRIRRSDTGPRIMRPTKLETDPEARGFGRRLPSLGVMIVVDASGSMSLSEDELREAMLAAPSSVVMCYSGPHVNHDGLPKVNARMLAEGDRVARRLKRMNGSNCADLPALEWAFDNRRGRPVIWVSDGAYTGCVVGPDGCLRDQDCGGQYLDETMSIFMVGNADQVARVPDVESLLNLLANWRLGNTYFPEDDRFGLNRRPIGSHI